MGKLVRMLTADGAVVVTAVDSTDIVNEMHSHHKTLELASAALGRLLTAASLMGYNLKNETDSLTLQIRGNGPLGKLIAVSDYMGNVRGYVENPAAKLPLNSKGKIDVGGGVGEGELYVVKDLSMKEPYSGCIPLVSGEIAEDITEYYAVSEQTPTVCALGVLVDRDYKIKHAGGYLLQLLPFTPDETIDKIEENLAKMPSITNMMLEGKGPEDFCRMLLLGMDPDILDQTETSYKCKCSKEKTMKALISLPKEDIKELSEDEKITVDCRFCSEKYVFTKNELLKLIDERG